MRAMRRGMYGQRLLSLGGWGPWTLVAGIALATLLVVPVRLAYAAEDDDIAATAERVEQANADYRAASEHLDEVNASIAANEQRIAEIQAELPAQRERSADSIRTLYKLQRSTGGLLDLILSSESFSTLISTLEYLNIISQRNTVEVTHLVDLAQELSVVQTSLEAQRVEAQQAADEAREALGEAQAARAEAQARAAAQAAQDAAEAQAALEAAQAAAAQEQTFTTASGNTAEVEVTDRPAGSAEVVHDAEAEDGEADSDTEGDGQDQGDEGSSGEETSDSGGSSGTVEEWAARIDAYLAGSPLAGQGYTFAQAALSYGVDPRWSPAISCIESSKGAHCFLPCNAWGWGQVSWGSWEEAIDAHVRGLASGYGYTISVWAAQKYCPPNWNYWYWAVSSEMNRI